MATFSDSHFAKANKILNYRESLSPLESAPKQAENWMEPKPMETTSLPEIPFVSTEILRRYNQCHYFPDQP